LPRGQPLVTVALLLVAVGAFWLFSTMFPDQVSGAYVGARRWLAAAGPIKKLPFPNPAAREEAPCRGTPQTLKPIAPDQYFPPGVLACDDQQEAFLTNWYSKALRALGEPTLWALSRDDSRAMVYRFLWLRSFHHPVSVRLVLKPDLTGVVISKSTGGAGGYDPGALIRNESASVGRRGTTLLLARLGQAHFWELPPRNGPGGVDGAQWVLEGVENGRYHVVDRWSPGETDAVYTLGMTFLLDLADMRIDPKEVY